MGGPAPFKEVVVWESLYPRCLAHSQTSYLPWIRMDVSVTILRDVTSDGSGRTVTELDPKAIRKLVKVSVLTLYV